MYAIIESCGRQYKVAEGDVVFFEKLEAEEGKKVTFDNVVLVSDDGKVQVGNPYVKGVKVEGKVVAHGKHKKIVVFKMKAKKNERTKQGHRQTYTKDEIKSVMTRAKKTEKKTVEKKKEDKKKKEKKKKEKKKKEKKKEKKVQKNGCYIKNKVLDKEI